MLPRFPQRLLQGWWLTAGLAGLALAGALAASTVSPGESHSDPTIEADPCFRYGRLECCIRESD